MKQYDVYALGNALVDIEYHVEPRQLVSMGIEKGVMTLIDEQQHLHLFNYLGDSHEKMASGGSAANSVIALAQMGGEAFFSCRLGDDIAGEFYIRDLMQTGVATNADRLLDPAGPTGKCLVFVTPDADRTMNTFLGVSAHLDETHVSELAIEASEWVYLEGYLVTADNSLRAVLEARRFAEEHGVKTALTLSDPNMMRFFRDGMLQMIGDGVDLLFANEEEASELANSADFDHVFESLKSCASSFAITRGARGAALWDGEQRIDIEPFPVTAIDTLGAGDMFAGAFLYGLTHGMDYFDSGRLACFAASRIVTRFGPRLELEETQRLLQRFMAGNFDPDTKE